MVVAVGVVVVVAAGVVLDVVLVEEEGTLLLAEMIWVLSILK